MSAAHEHNPKSRRLTTTTVDVPPYTDNLSGNTVLYTVLVEPLARRPDRLKIPPLDIPDDRMRFRPMHSENEVQNQNWRPVLWTVFCAKMVLADVLPGRFYKTLHVFERFMLSIMPCIGLCKKPSVQRFCVGNIPKISCASHQ